MRPWRVKPLPYLGAQGVTGGPQAEGERQGSEFRLSWGEGELNARGHRAQEPAPWGERPWAADLGCSGGVGVPGGLMETHALSSGQQGPSQS